MKADNCRLVHDAISSGRKSPFHARNTTLTRMMQNIRLHREQYSFMATLGPSVVSFTTKVFIGVFVVMHTIHTNCIYSLRIRFDGLTTRFHTVRCGHLISNSSANCNPTLCQINTIAEKLGAGVYFNTLVPWHQGFIKYGVVSVATLERDLLDWNALYLAGRMHKPVQTLARSPFIESAQQKNVQAALRAALLLLPEKFNAIELLRAICTLSYAGDFRMGIAEDAQKVDRIVQGSFDRLLSMYSPSLHVAEHMWKTLQSRTLHSSPRESCFMQDCGLSAQAQLFAALPASLLGKLVRGCNFAARVPVSSAEAREAAGMHLAQLPNRVELLQRCLSATVRASSRRQAVAGLLSAGVVKSTRYAWQKILKAWSLRRPT